MGQSATTCLSYQLVSSMGIAGLLLPDEPEMTPEPPRLSNGLWMDDRETDAGDGDRDMDIALPPDPPALEDVSSSVMRAQFQRKGIETLELQGKQPEYEYGFDRSHGKAWRMRILGPKKRGPTEWSCPPSLDDRGPHAAVRCSFADGDVFESGLVTQVSCLRSILKPQPKLEMHLQINKP